MSVSRPDDPAASVLEFRASDGYPLRFRRWGAAQPETRGFVVALHGIQSHSGWYGYSSARLAEGGWRVDFLDRRGSGLNDVDRGHVRHHERLVNDVVQFLAEVGHERDVMSPGAPLVLLGVSWGAKLAAAVAAGPSSSMDWRSYTPASARGSRQPGRRRQV